MPTKNMKLITKKWNYRTIYSKKEMSGVVVASGNNIDESILEKILNGK